MSRRVAPRRCRRRRRRRGEILTRAIYGKVWILYGSAKNDIRPIGYVDIDRPVAGCEPAPVFPLEREEFCRRLRDPIDRHYLS